MSWIKEVALSARVFGAEEALRVGLVSRVVEDKGAAVKEVSASSFDILWSYLVDATFVMILIADVFGQALELASLIASKSPVAVLGTKEILNYSRDKTVAEGLNYTAVWNAAMLQTDDIKEAMLSGMQKKQVKFSKL